MWRHLDKRATDYLQSQRSKRREVERKRRELEQHAALDAAAEARRRAKQAEGGSVGAGDGIQLPSLPPPTDDYLKARYGEGGAVPIGLGTPSGYKRQIDEGPALDLDESTDDWQLRKKDPSLYLFLQLRQRFVHGMKGSEGKRIKLNDPNDTFNFGAYLTQCSAGITAEIVEVHPVTWVLVATSIILVYLFNSLFSMSAQQAGEEAHDNTGICIVLLLWGWFCVLVLLWLKRALHGMVLELSPPPTSSLEQIRSGDPDALPPYMLRPQLKRADRHEALYPLRLSHRGPEWMCHIVRTVLLTDAVYVIGLQSIFAAEMLQQPGVIGVFMLVAALLSVVVAMYLLLPLLPLLVVTQSVGMMKKDGTVQRVFRQQKLDLSLRLLKLLTVMQSHSRQLRKLKSRAASVPADERQLTDEEVKAEQMRAMAVLDRNPQMKAELEQAFRLFDTTNDDHIDGVELKALLHSMGQKVTDAEAIMLLCAHAERASTARAPRCDGGRGARARPPPPSRRRASRPPSLAPAPAPRPGGAATRWTWTTRARSRSTSSSP